MSNNYDGKFERTPAPAKVPEVKKVPFRRKFNRFRRAIRKNRYYRIALYTLICLIISICSRVYQASVDKTKYLEMMEAQKIEVAATYEIELGEQRMRYENEIRSIRAEYENLTPEELLRQEAEYMAKVFYGTALNHDERDQRSLAWCILNRVDSAGFPSTVKEVCQQPSQWIGYSDDNPILSELYDLALKELETWHSNYRPVSKDYVYMSWSSNEIKLRDTYEKTNATRYWQAG